MWKTFSRLEEKEAMVVLDRCSDDTRSDFNKALHRAIRPEDLSKE